MGFYDIMSVAGSIAMLVLVLVLAATYYLTRWYARRMRLSGGGKYIKVLDRMTVGQGSSLAVIQVGGRHYLVGLGDKQVNLLCEIPDLEEPPADGPETAPMPFQKVFQDLVDRAKNKKDGDGGSK